VFFDPETEQTQTWKPKTGTQRAIPMNDITRTLLLDVRDKNETKPACKRSNSLKIISTNRDRENLDSKSRSPRECPWVFTDHRSATSPSRDRRISEGWLLRYLKRILEKLGLKGHLHTFRHSFVSNALIKETPEVYVREWVGHVDKEMLKQYTHIADQASRQAMQRLVSHNHQIADSGKEHCKEANNQPQKPEQNKHNAKNARKRFAATA
jgi:integrase